MPLNNDLRWSLRQLADCLTESRGYDALRDVLGEPLTLGGYRCGADSALDIVRAEPPWKGE